MATHDEDWPNVHSISVDLPTQSMFIAPEAVGAMYRLVYFCASQVVNLTYSHPSGDMSFPADEKRILLITGLSKKAWRTWKDEILQPFEFVDGRYVLSDPDIVRLTRARSRTSVPVAVSAAAFIRDRNACVYCGDTKGPFEKDHLWPVSRGGDNSASNIVIACKPCNRSKSDKTLLEWMQEVRS